MIEENKEKTIIMVEVPYKLMKEYLDKKKEVEKKCVKL